MFAPLQSSIVGRAFLCGAVSFETVDIRQFSACKHSKCDDIPFGGGQGMVMTPQPIVDCVRATDPDKKARRIYLSPRGKKLDNQLAKELANEQSLLLLCGHYEGVDQRALDICEFEEISIGDFVLTGGELAACVLIDCVLRFCPLVLGSDKSAEEESFSESLSGLLEYPHYTRPQEFEGHSVPQILLSGHHKNIEKWRKERSLEITKQNRPDLLK